MQSTKSKQSFNRPSDNVWQEHTFWNWKAREALRKKVRFFIRIMACVTFGKSLRAPGMVGSGIWLNLMEFRQAWSTGSPCVVGRINVERDITLFQIYFSFSRWMKCVKYYWLWNSIWVMDKKGVGRILGCFRMFNCIATLHVLFDKLKNIDARNTCDIFRKYCCVQIKN